MLEHPRTQVQKEDSLSRTLHGFFEASVRRFPSSIAIDVPPWGQGSERQLFTYSDIEQRANALAASMADQVEAETIVALLMDRNDDAVFVAQLASLKAGGAYLCLDPSFPDDRLQFTLEDAAPQVVITSARYRARLTGLVPDSVRIIEYERWLEDTDLPTVAAQYIAPEIDDNQLAYVIYTSGTTGRPKGVMVEHRHVVNLLVDNLTYFDLGPHDRIIQNSSTAYDSSIEETYMAFCVGGTLVVGRDEVIRMGPDLTDWLIEERITAFCPPPTLLRTIGGAAAAARLTDLRLLYVGGEALTSDVVDTWAPGRRLDNGYGPTECAITVCRTVVGANDPKITIGTVVPNNVAWILDEQLNVVADGESGELCIEGASVTRGYLNRPELTKEKFYEHPECGRIYRTGDLVQRLPDGNLLFMGRIDTQVKLRGYRVELTDIESHTNEFPGVASVACKVQGQGGVQQLIAFVVSETDETVDFNALRDYLAELLPPYMVPARFEAMESLPTTTSGKLNRKALPSIEFKVERAADYVGPRSQLEEAIATAFGTHLGLPDAVSIHDDFFTAGGDSLLGAMVISDLRLDPETAGLTMRDLYECRTIAGLAERIETSTEDDALLPAISPPQGSILSTHLAIMSVLGAFLVSGSAVAYILGFVLLPWILSHFSLLATIIGLPIVAMVLRALFIPLGIGFAVFAKRVLIGTYEAGQHPVWGSYYLRHWLVQRAAQLIPWGTIAGTELHCMALRLLGARIGENVHIHKGVQFSNGGWDLLTIGDNVTLGRDAAVRLIDFESQTMFLGPILIGDDVTLETRAGVSAFAELGAGAYVTALSHVESGTKVPADTRWHGIPGSADGPAPALVPVTHEEKTWSPIAHATVFIGANLLLGLAIQLPWLLAVIGLVLLTDVSSMAAIDWLYSPSGILGNVVIILLAVAISGPLLSLPMYALMCRALGRVKPGVYDRRGWTLMVTWFKDGYVEAANRWLSGTLFWPVWLRWAGMKVGRDSEISTIMEVIPELVSIDGRCFFADGIYLGGAKIHRGHYVLETLSFSQNTFLGNHAIIPAGTHLPTEILIGICTVADGEQIKESTSWFGHPIFELPRREVVEVDPSLTHNPPWYRYLMRLSWESARFLIPVLPTFLALFWIKYLLSVQSVVSPPLFYTVVLPLYSLGLTSVLCLVVLSLKWILLGRTKAGQHPLWSSWCCRWDFLYVVWGAWARPVMRSLEGTLFVNAWLRLFGVRIGRRVFLGAGFAQVVDPDMLVFEDGATVINHFQAHSFEDRVLKTAPVYIRRNATVRSHAVMLYGADIGQNAVVGEHSVIMKNEYLRPDRYYVGAPTRPCVPNQAYLAFEAVAESELVNSPQPGYNSSPEPVVSTRVRA